MSLKEIPVQRALGEDTLIDTIDIQGVFYAVHKTTNNEIALTDKNDPSRIYALMNEHLYNNIRITVKDDDRTGTPGLTTIVETSSVQRLDHVMEQIRRVKDVDAINQNNGVDLQVMQIVMKHAKMTPAQAAELLGIRQIDLTYYLSKMKPFPKEYYDKMCEHLKIKTTKTTGSGGNDDA